MKTIILCLLLMVSISIQATTYYFSSSTGADVYTAEQAQNQATPWETINKLNDIMGTLQPGDMVLFKRGDSFPGSITIGASGSAGHSITFGAYGSGTSKPVLDNRLILTGWVALGGNIWEATSIVLNGQPTALMINDVLQPLGRYPNIDAPNRGYLTITSHPAGSKTEFSDNTLMATPDWTGAEVVVRTVHWRLERRTAASHSGQTITLDSDTGHEITDQFGYFFQNHPEALDKDGEWCYITSGNKVHLYSTTDPNAKVIKVANTDKYFDCNTWSYLVIDGFVMRGAKKCAINLTKATYCTVKNCDFLASGVGAIIINSSDSITIINNTFNKTQSNCITAFGTRIAIQNNIIKNTGMVPGMGESGQKCFGIQTSGQDLLIERNVLDSTGYVPITFGGASTVLVKDNLINHFCSVIDDGGAIYCWESPTLPEPVDRKIINNIVLNGVGAPEGTDGYASYAVGIYMDDRTPNVEVSGNTVAFCAQSGILIHNSRKITVKNNTVFSCGNALWILHDNIAPTYPVIDCDIQNNLLVGNSPDIAKSLLTFQTRDETTLAKLGTLDNNIYCQPFFINDYIRYLYIPSSVQKSLSLNLTEWRAFSGYDGSTTPSPRRFPLMFGKILSTNGITNSTFSDNTNGWKTWNPSGTTSTLSWINGQLDGGSLSFTVTSGAANSARLQTTLPSITSGKTYLLKLSTKGTVSGSINCYLLQNISPYPWGSATYTVKVGATRLDQEILITATNTLPTPSLFIFAGPEDGTVYIDNVEFYEVTPSNPNDYIRFEYNTTAVASTIIADKNYITPAGVSYTSGSTILIPAFSSVVLLKADAEIVTGIRPVSRTENQVFKLYPNPADDKAYIIGEFGVLPAEATLYDLSGRVIRREMISAGSPIDIRSLLKGSYLIRISGNKQSQTLKLIKR